MSCRDGGTMGRVVFGPVGNYTSACGCICHSFGAGTAGVAHPGLPCWCYQSQAPVVVEPPKFCPHCGKKI